MNRMLHIAAGTQVRFVTEGRAIIDLSSLRARAEWRACAASRDGSLTLSAASSCLGGGGGEPVPDGRRRRRKTRDAVTQGIFRWHLAFDAR